ncbi:hydroxymethylglutaryl-CoA lyase [bacterium]|nr:hydroxymethylglutaryl-CoA lyase [bacterium]
MNLQLTDVTLRDGLQMEKQVLGVEQKLQLLQRLKACGFSRIEITSFVNPKRVPQFADSEAFCQAVFAQAQDVPLMAFVPNEKGMERLLAFPIPWAACFVSVSEAFNSKNVNATVDESLAQVQAVVKSARQAGRKVRVYISTVFGCPYQGAIQPETLKRVFQTVAESKPDEIALGDTIGVATPNQVREVLAVLAKYFPVAQTALHLHNTYGLAVSAARAGYDAGVRLFDGATGGIGGCPYAKGASGNVASEDLAYAFWRDKLTPSFAAKQFQQALEDLSSAGMNPQGRLSEVWKKGGQWYGI